MPKLAVVQKAPSFLNKEQSINIAVENIQEAARQGADIIVFTETFIPGYPAWIWRLRPGVDWNVSEELYRRLLNNAVTIEKDLEPLCDAARESHTIVVCGIEERDSQLSRSTLYNTAVVIGPDGTVLNKHRKLMPTNPERMVWGFGDASGLKVVDTPAGRISTLLCWENYMPLARYALYSQGVEIYIAPTYDSGDNWLCSLQHIAREGRCWVVGCGNLIQARNLPADFPEKETLYPDVDEWINPGDSIVIAPDGEISSGPLRKEEGILYCDIDLETVATAKRTLDVAGHYSRPDIFTLHINNKRQTPVKFND
ncbi:MAG: nitrilase [Desulfuromonas sp.]|nr:MAG: nitrilase [Desulfuromonas sp.]